MGIVNVTPDSFSDGGRFASTDAAIAHGLRLAGEGADIVDVGGESTRPGATELSVAEERARVVPVVHALASAGIYISIDTRHAAVMQAAIDAGAKMLNDISGLCHDPGSMAVAASFDGPVVVMHMRGTPTDMASLTDYPDGVVASVRDWLARRVEACANAGIAPERLVLDPGIGFAKTAAQNLQLLACLPVLCGLGPPLLVGVSRKSFIGRVAGVEAVDRRLPGSLAAALWAVRHGVAILRVHDVAETRQALSVWQAIAAAGSETDTATGTAIGQRER